MAFGYDPIEQNLMYLGVGATIEDTKALFKILDSARPDNDIFYRHLFEVDLGTMDNLVAWLQRIGVSEEAAEKGMANFVNNVDFSHITELAKTCERNRGYLLAYIDQSNNNAVIFSMCVTLADITRQFEQKCQYEYRKIFEIRKNVFQRIGAWLSEISVISNMDLQQICNDIIQSAPAKIRGILEEYAK